MRPSDAEWLYPWLRHMVRMHARACNISQATGVSTTLVRDLWRDVHARSSPSGQQPTDTAWFLKTAKRKMHSALLLLLYQKAVQTQPKKIAFASAYWHYASMTVTDSKSAMGPYRASEADYVVPYSRGSFLAGIYTEKTDPQGRRFCPLHLKQCRTCQSIFLGESLKCEPKCPICSGEVDT
jgi:hypothetical protein